MYALPHSKPVWHAASRLHLLERLAVFPLWKENGVRQRVLKLLRQYAAQSPEPAAWWPALSHIVEAESDLDILEQLADWPLPDRVPSGAEAWYIALVAAWDRKRDLTRDDSPQHFWINTTALRALVHLDGCAPVAGTQRPSRLPEWLEETRRIQELKNRFHLQERLATLARWRPAPDVLTAPADLHSWCDFWKDAHARIWKWGDERLIPVILQAQLNSIAHPVPDAASPTETLLDCLTSYIRKAASGTAKLDIWTPTRHQVAGQGAAMRLADALCEAVVSLELEQDRSGACRMLIALERNSHDERLQKDFLMVVENAIREDAYLWPTLSTWIPSPACVANPAVREQLTAIYNEWVNLSRQTGWGQERWGWSGRFAFRNAGLASYPDEEELQELNQAIQTWTDSWRLDSLAAWQPPTNLPPDQQGAWRQCWRTTLTNPDANVRLTGWLVLEHHCERQFLPPDRSGPPHWWGIHHVCRQMREEITTMAKAGTTLPEPFNLHRLNEIVMALSHPTPSGPIAGIPPPVGERRRLLQLPPRETACGQAPQEDGQLPLSAPPKPDQRA